MRFRHGLEFVGICKQTADEIGIVAGGVENTTTFPVVIGIQTCRAPLANR